MRPDYLADVRVGKLHIERLKNFVRASGTCTNEELSRATTKFALISLAEAKSVGGSEEVLVARMEWRGCPVCRCDGIRGGNGGSKGG